jgi:ABC-type polysaccharide/polyol phosphate transport system ATPase subunit
VSSTPAIDVDHVSKRFRLYHERNQTLKSAVMRGRRARYEEFWALRDVSLEIPEGATYGLIGENGSGKSTLLKCMARILRPDKGSVGVKGRLSALLELGAGFHPELSGRENIFLNAAILGMAKRDVKDRFDAIVAFAGLEKFIDFPVKNYSSGMYLRLGFSVAINVEPDIMLVDEIFAVGDAEFQARCNDKFAEMKAQGKTLVMVTHGLETVRNMCETAALLHEGSLQMVGPASQVVDAYNEGVHTDRTTDGIESRWGSGEARIERIELIGPNGKSTHIVRTGDAVTIRIHYATREPIERPIFALGIFTVGGAHIAGPASRDQGVVPEKIDGTGHIDFGIPRLPLLAGAYDVSAVLSDFTITHEYDRRNRTFRFDVRRGEADEHQGVVTMGGTWEIHPSEGSI